jgi:heterotetrameric sarcosine oxidase delta subunit
MLLDCPHCGPRDIGEFVHQGEVVPRPDPGSATPEQWRAYLYLRDNPAGPVREQWLHRAGCRRFFQALRDTTDNSVRETVPLGRDRGGDR